MDKRKALLSAAVAGLIVAGAVAKTIPAQADEATTTPTTTEQKAEKGDKDSCKGKDGCKGKNAAAADKDSCKGKDHCKGKHKHTKVTKETTETSEAPATPKAE